MKQHNPRVLVYGATGSQARPVISELQKKGYIPVAVTRSQQKAKQLEKEKIQAVVATMADAEKIHEITRGVDIVSLLIPFFVSNPSDGIRFAKNAIDASRNGKVRLIVWNASGPVPEHLTGNPAIDLRIEIAGYLKKSGIPYVILQPGVYAENLFGPWTAPFVKDDNELRYPFPDHVKVGWLPAVDLAKITAAVISNELFVGETISVSGVENLSGSALAHEFSTGLNRTIRYREMTPAEFGKILDTTFGEGAGEKAAQEYQRMWDTAQFPNMHFPMKDMLRKLSVEMTPISAWVARHSHHFTSPQKA